MLRPFEEVNVTEAKIDLIRSEQVIKHSLNMKPQSNINWTEFDTPVEDQVGYRY